MSQQSCFPIKHALTILVLATALAWASTARADYVIDGPIEIVAPPMPQSVSLTDVAQLAFMGRGWTVGPVENNSFDANLELRSHRVSVRAVDQGDRLAVTYLDSTDMRAKPCKNDQAKTCIHPNYETWINFVGTDMALKARELEILLRVLGR